MKTRILFIGNSYTYFHDMPESIFLPMAKEAGLDAQVTAVTHGGYWLRWFADPENEEGKRLRSVIEGQHYDWVVLQDYSLATIQDPRCVLWRHPEIEAAAGAPHRQVRAVRHLGPEARLHHPGGNRHDQSPDGPPDRRAV